MKNLIVLDFDGTLTDAEVEGEGFTIGYLEDLAALTGQPYADIVPLAERFEAEVCERSQEFGWLYDGQIVAPATVDPYLRMMPVARKLLDHFGAFGVEQERARLLEGILFRYNYPKTKVCFRPGAAKVLGRLSQRSAFIVTNSHTEAVQRKIVTLPADDTASSLADTWTERVRGGARKYVVDDSFSEVPRELRISGLSRPVLLRRRHYHGVLCELCEKVGVDFTELLVVGDIFELDLALPLELGATVALVRNSRTPDYEVDFARIRARRCCPVWMSCWSLSPSPFGADLLT